MVLVGLVSRNWLAQAGQVLGRIPSGGGWRAHARASKRIGTGTRRVGYTFLWSQRGAHLLLQVRTRVLNDDLAADFARWYPVPAALGQQRIVAAA